MAKYLNRILYGLVTVHGLLIGSDFQGMVIAGVNFIPLIWMGVLLIKDRRYKVKLQ